MFQKLMVLFWVPLRCFCFLHGYSSEASDEINRLFIEGRSRPWLLEAFSSCSSVSE